MLLLAVVIVTLLQTLCSWLTTVKRNYRAVAYHNWRHAFNVAQTMFAIITVSVTMVTACMSNIHLDWSPG